MYTVQCIYVSMYSILMYIVYMSIIYEYNICVYSIYLCILYIYTIHTAHSKGYSKRVYHTVINLGIEPPLIVLSVWHLIPHATN